MPGADRSTPPPGGDPWTLCFVGFDPAVEGAREALLTIGNGYLATRGAMTHAGSDEVHCPGTYVAGIYDRLTSVVEGRRREDESMVNLPSWLPLTFRCAGGPWVAPGTARVEDHRVCLDLRRAVLTREAVLVDVLGRRTRLRERRLVSMADPHLAALEVGLTPCNWAGRLEVRSLVDGGVTNRNVPAYRALAGRHLEVCRLWHDGPVACVAVETVQSRVRVVVAARTLLRSAAGAAADAAGGAVAVAGGATAGHELAVDLGEGEEVVVEKTVGVATSRDLAISEASVAAVRTARDAPAFGEVLAAHASAWAELWRRFGLDLDGDAWTALAVRVHLVQLLQALSPHTTDLDVGVPARGLHGEAYRGHVFWDELFVFPLLDLRLPELTRSLLLYRWRRLPEARRRALRLGARGALFPWQSGSDGREETPPELLNPRSGRWVPDHSARQYHINVAIAYNVWQHWQVTGDLGFLVRHGAELLVETARFFASLATLDPATGRFDLRGVMGPDEFHDGYPDRPGEGVDNNAYLNVMASWALARAGEVHRLLGPSLGGGLWERIGLHEDELVRWEQVGRGLTVPFLRNGLLAQFAGYDDLVELDWAAYRRRYGDIGRLDLILEAEGDSTNRYQVSKQADTLMLLFLLPAEELTAVVRRMGYAFDPGSIPATVEHYLARTSHGSTLSRVAHAWVLARTDRTRSWRLLQQALAGDLDAHGGTTSRGIHLGAMAGSVDLLERCYTGLHAAGDVLHFNPLLPDELPRLGLVLRYRNHVLTVDVDHDELRIRSAAGPAAPVTIAFRDDRRRLQAGRSVRFGLRRRPATAGRPPKEPLGPIGRRRGPATVARDG